MQVVKAAVIASMQERLETRKRKEMLDELDEATREVDPEAPPPTKRSRQNGAQTINGAFERSTKHQVRGSVY